MLRSPLKFAGEIGVGLTLATVAVIADDYALENKRCRQDPLRAAGSVLDGCRRRPDHRHTSVRAHHRFQLNGEASVAIRVHAPEEPLVVLTDDQIDQVAGGPIWWVVGGVAGGLMEYADRSDDGDMTRADWGAVVGRAVLGGMTGGVGGTVVRVVVRISRR